MTERSGLNMTDIERAIMEHLNTRRDGWTLQSKIREHLDCAGIWSPGVSLTEQILDVARAFRNLYRGGYVELRHGGLTKNRNVWRINISSEGLQQLLAAQDEDSERVEVRSQPMAGDKAYYTYANSLGAPLAHHVFRIIDVVDEHWVVLEYWDTVNVAIPDHFSPLEKPFYMTPIANIWMDDFHEFQIGAFPDDYDGDILYGEFKPFERDKPFITWMKMWAWYNELGIYYGIYWTEEYVDGNRKTWSADAGPNDENAKGVVNDTFATLLQKLFDEGAKRYTVEIIPKVINGLEVVVRHEVEYANVEATTALREMFTNIVQDNRHTLDHNHPHSIANTWR